MTILAVLLGLPAGALINLLADYLPHTYHIGRPIYPDQTPRPLIAWLGLTAYLFGKTKSPQGAKLPLRHPITELVTVALFVIVASQSADTLRTLYLLGSLTILILITVIDLEHRMILYAVIIPACLYALLGAIALGDRLDPRLEVRDYLIGGAVGFAVFGGMFLGGLLFNRVISDARGEKMEEAAFGDGDVALATLSGLMLGWQAFIFAAIIAVFAGGLGALLFIIARSVLRGRYEAFTALPYGQYIVFGTLIMLLWRAPLIMLLQRFG
ncbi:MAG: hypothetical protein OHK0023_22290 [Anaerolineae bacterium]